MNQRIKTTYFNAAWRCHTKHFGYHGKPFSLPLALLREASTQTLDLAFEIKQMFLRSSMELSYESFPEGGKNAVLKQLFLPPSPPKALYILSERENRSLYLALTFSFTR